MTIIGKKDKCPGDKLEHIAADDTTGVGEEDNEELVEKSQSDVNSQEHISSTNQTVSPELASQAAMLNWHLLGNNAQSCLSVDPSQIGNH